MLVDKYVPFNLSSVTDDDLKDRNYLAFLWIFPSAVARSIAHDDNLMCRALLNHCIRGTKYTREGKAVGKPKISDVEANFSPRLCIPPAIQRMFKIRSNSKMRKDQITYCQEANGFIDVEDLCPINDTWVAGVISLTVDSLRNKGIRFESEIMDQVGTSNTTLYNVQGEWMRQSKAFETEGPSDPLQAERILSEIIQQSEHQPAQIGEHPKTDNPTTDQLSQQSGEEEGSMTTLLANMEKDYEERKGEVNQPGATEPSKASSPNTDHDRKINESESSTINDDSRAVRVRDCGHVCVRCNGEAIKEREGILTMIKSVAEESRNPFWTDWAPNHVRMAILLERVFSFDVIHSAFQESSTDIFDTLATEAWAVAVINYIACSAIISVPDIRRILVVHNEVSLEERIKTAISPLNLDTDLCANVRQIKDQVQSLLTKRVSLESGPQTFSINTTRVDLEPSARHLLDGVLDGPAAAPLTTGIQPSPVQTTVQELTTSDGLYTYHPSEVKIDRTGKRFIYRITGLAADSELKKIYLD